jgi:hypothetical protein
MHPYDNSGPKFGLIKDPPKPKDLYQDRCERAWHELAGIKMGILANLPKDEKHRIYNALRILEGKSPLTE